MSRNRSTFQYHGARRSIRSLACLAALTALGSVGCTSNWGHGEIRAPETVIALDRANFKTTVVHAVGRATRHYVFWIPVSGPSDVGSAAWRRMKRNAGIDGTSAQFVNVTEQPTEQAVVWPIYYKRVHTVSADAITFNPRSRGSGGKADPRGPDRE
jgi:hypothetical protein